MSIMSGMSPAAISAVAFSVYCGSGPSVMSSCAPIRLSSSSRHWFWSCGTAGGFWDAFVIEILLPLPGITATDLKGAGGVRYASGTLGAGDGIFPLVAALAVPLAVVPAGATALAADVVATGAVAADDALVAVGALVAGAVVGAPVGAGVAIGLLPPPQATRSALLAESAAPPSAMRRTLRRVNREGTPRNRRSSRIARHSFQLLGDSHPRWRDDARFLKNAQAR